MCVCVFNIFIYLFGFNFRLMTTESYTHYDTIMKYYGNSTHLGAQIPFNFALVDCTRNRLVESFEEAINIWLSQIPKNAVPNWVV